MYKMILKMFSKTECYATPQKHKHRKMESEFPKISAPQLTQIVVPAMFRQPFKWKDYSSPEIQHSKSQFLPGIE